LEESQEVQSIADFMNLQEDHQNSTGSPIASVSEEKYENLDDMDGIDFAMTADSK
jgi:hypothetical protein